MIIGIVNHEYEEVSYKILIRLDNETIGKIDNIILSHGERWEGSYTFTPGNVGERMKLEFLLYRDDMNETYRDLHLWITVHPSE